MGVVMGSRDGGRVIEVVMMGALMCLLAGRDQGGSRPPSRSAGSVGPWSAGPLLGKQSSGGPRARRALPWPSASTTPRLVFDAPALFRVVRIPLDHGMARLESVAALRDIGNSRRHSPTVTPWLYPQLSASSTAALFGGIGGDNT